MGTASAQASFEGWMSELAIMDLAAVLIRCGLSKVTAAVGYRRALRCDRSRLRTEETLEQRGDASEDHCEDWSNHEMCEA